LGRFFAVDPLASKYPHNGPYNFSENRVIDGIELEGLEVFIGTETKGTGHVFLAVVTKGELTIYTYGRYGEVTGIGTTGEGVLITKTGKDAWEYLNTEVKRMDAKMYEITDVGVEGLMQRMKWADKKGTTPKDWKSDSKNEKGSTIDTYGLTSSNCTTHSMGWLISEGTKAFEQTDLFGDEYNEWFVLPESLNEYLEEEDANNKHIRSGEYRINSMLKDYEKKQKLGSAGSTQSSSGSSGTSSGSTSGKSSEITGSSSGGKSSSGSHGAGSSSSGKNKKKSN
jgi:hypothetical protein